MRKKGVGGVCSIFCVRPEKFAPNRWSQIHLEDGGAPVAKKSALLRSLYRGFTSHLIRHAPVRIALDRRLVCISTPNAQVSDDEEGHAELSGSEEPVSFRHQCQNEGYG